MSKSQTVISDQQSAISDQLSVIRKKISGKDKNSANFIWLAIIFSISLIANFPVTPTDISAPARSAAAATAAESFLVLATEFTEDTEITTKIKTATAYRSTRSQTPACGFSLTQAGNFNDSHKGTKAQRISIADSADFTDNR